MSPNHPARHRRTPFLLSLLTLLAIALGLAAAASQAASAPTLVGLETAVWRSASLTSAGVRPQPPGSLNTRRAAAFAYDRIAVATGVAAKAVEDAYDIAAAGGKHAGFLKNYAGRSPQEIDRGIRSIQREIAEHQAAILDPRTKIPNFAGLDPRQQVALVTKKWPSDIARQQEQLAILQRLRSGG